MQQPQARDYQRPERLDAELDYPLIVRITRAHRLFGCCLRAGWNADDLVSEVVVRVIARQDQSSRYDPQRAPLGVYLTVLTRGILANLLELEAGRQRREAEVRRVLRAEADLQVLEAEYEVVPVRAAPTPRRDGVIRRRSR